MQAQAQMSCRNTLIILYTTKQTQGLGPLCLHNATHEKEICYHVIAHHSWQNFSRASKPAFKRRLLLPLYNADKNDIRAYISINSTILKEQGAWSYRYTDADALAFLHDDSGVICTHRKQCIQSGPRPLSTLLYMCICASNMIVRGKWSLDKQKKVNGCFAPFFRSGPTILAWNSSQAS